MGPETVSVIMSVRNESDYIEDCLESLLKQTRSPFEVLIVDDNSADNTVEILESYIKRFRLYGIQTKIWCNRESLGLPHNLNFLISKVEGNFIARMDGDDICSIDRFDRQVRFITENHLDFAGSDIDLIDSDGSRYGERRFPKTQEEIMAKLKIRSPFNHPSVMFKRECFDFFSYNSEFVLAQDVVLWADLLSNGFRAGNVSDRLLMHRVPVSASSRKGITRARFELNAYYYAQSKLGYSLVDRVLLYVRFIFRISMNRRLLKLITKYSV